MNRLVGFGLILLLLSGCGTIYIVSGNKTVGKVKLYAGPSLPDSEVSILRGISYLKSDDVKDSNIAGRVWHNWMSETSKVDGKDADGEPAPGYCNYSRREKLYPPVGKGNIDYHLEPGVHSIATYIISLVGVDLGTIQSSSKPVTTEYRLVYDFKKGAKYRIGTHFKMLEGSTSERVLYTLTVWLQQENADGSVVDVAKFEKID